MEPLWLGAAFIGGILARMLGMPPLIGFLAAGVGLQLNGAHLAGGENAWLGSVSSLGVELLLFTLGIKIQIRQLVMPAVWAGGMIAMAASTLLAVLFMRALAIAGLGVFELSFSELIVVGFALSFSSTVLVSAVLQSKGELDNEQGKLAIGILIIQDIAAVVFLVFSKGALPSIWAVGLLALPFLRPFIFRLLDKSGHDEMLVLYGFGLAIGMGALFDGLGLKAHLGALVAGLLINQHPRANELAKSLLNFKDLFLVGFFLEIGLNMAIDLQALIAALFLMLLIPFKPIIFFFSSIGFGVRARTLTLASFALTNYSEFGLIVAVVAVNAGWLDSVWLSVLAIVLVLSFVISAPANKRSQAFWRKQGQWLRRFETVSAKNKYPHIDLQGVDTIIFGMGRIGKGAYDFMSSHGLGTVAGVDVNPMVAERYAHENCRIFIADGNDFDFWEGLQHCGVKKIMLALPNHIETIEIVRMIRATGFKGQVAAVGRYDDELQRLKNAGVDAAFNIYMEAGAGFAEHVSEVLGGDSPDAISAPSRRS